MTETPGNTPEPPDGAPPLPADQRPDWARVHLWQIQVLRDVAVVGVAVAIVLLGYAVSIVTVPLLLSLLLAYVLEPVTAWLAQRAGLGRRRAVIAVLFAVVLLVIVPAVVGIGFAGVQAVSLARGVATNASAAVSSALAPDDEELEADVPEGAWSWLRDRLAESALIAEPDSTAQPDPDAPANGTPPADTGSTPSTAEPGPSTTDDDQPAADDPSPGPGPDPDPARQSDTDLTAAGMPTEGQPAEDRSAESAPAEDPSEDPAETDGFLRGLTDLLPSFGEERPPRPNRGAAAATAAMRWLQANSDSVTAGVLSTSADVFRFLASLLGGAAALGFTAFLTLFFFYFIATAWPRVLRFATEFIPDAQEDTVVDLARRMDQVISGFVRGRLTIALILGFWFSIGWWIVGVPAPFLIGMVTGLLAIAPYAALLGLPVAMILHWLDGGTWYLSILLPGLIYQAGQLADDYLLTPWIVGKETNLDIPTVLFAVLAGGVLLGVYGLLIAIPIAACAKILIREIVWPRFQAWIRGEESDFLPIR